MACLSGQDAFATETEKPSWHVVQSVCAFGKFLEESTKLLIRIFVCLEGFCAKLQNCTKNCQYEENFFDLKLLYLLSFCKPLLHWQKLKLEVNYAAIS